MSKPIPRRRNSKACIIFIDELDGIGQKSSIHLGAVNDEREQTLNQLLSQMDGFETNAGVIILAATNRPEVLDAALLRPGRFDRQVIVDTPYLDGREAILKVHARGKRLASEVDLRQLAQATARFSGADLANLLNEAALQAARRDATEIIQVDLENAVEKVVAGPERKSRRLTEQQKRRVAYHELGHALVAAYSQDADPVREITIIPHGHAALGYTLQVTVEEQFLLSQAELLTRSRGMLGGRASEEQEYGDLITRAQNDLEHATAGPPNGLSLRNERKGRDGQLRATSASLSAGSVFSTAASRRRGRLMKRSTKFSTTVVTNSSAERCRSQKTPLRCRWKMVLPPFLLSRQAQGTETKPRATKQIREGKQALPGEFQESN